MMLDTTVCEPENEVYGEIKEGTLEWMEECLKEAYAEGITVIPVGHHNLQRLSRVYVEECVIENCDEVLELFERYLTPVYFSGHLHTQKVMKHLTEPGMDSDTYGIWEIVSNSLIVPVRNSDIKYGRQHRLSGEDCECFQLGGCEWGDR